MASKVIELTNLVVEMAEDEFEGADVKFEEPGDCDFRVGPVEGGMVHIGGHGDYDLTQDFVDDVGERARDEMDCSVDSEFVVGENRAKFSLKP